MIANWGFHQCILATWAGALLAAAEGTGDDLLAAWTFESSLAHGAAAPGVIAAIAAEANLSASALWSGDFRTGAACREYPGNATGSSADPGGASRVSFTVTATGGTTVTLRSVRWWSKARSFATGATGVHDTVRTRLYWSVDGFSEPVSPEVVAMTDTQLGDGSWSGSWVQGNADFAPVTVMPGESVTFRLVVWDQTTSSSKILRLEDFEVHGSVVTGPADGFDALRQTWRDHLTGGPALSPDDPVVASKLQALANAAIGWRDSLVRGPDRTHLWPDIASTTISSQFNENYVRLREMALAHATPGCALYQNEALRDDILGGLDWLRANRYFAGKARYDNWWHWEIGAPQRLGDILLLMHDDLGITRLAENLGTLAFFVPGSGGWMTGANRSDKCLAAAVHGLLARRDTRLAAARDELTPVFPYVATGDGFRRDGSFIQHTAIAYTGSYGTELINGVGRLYALLQGTPWQLTDPLHENLFAWIERGYAPLYFRGAMPDHVRGRAISRQGSTDHSTGHTIMRHILMIANAAPPERGTPIRAWLREQALSDTSRDFAAGAPLANYAAARALMLDDSLPLTAPPPAHLRFQEMDRVVHRRAGYAYGLAMSSSRIYTYESLNQENLRGWFTGEGVLSFHNHDLRQFELDYWATVDPYHLPGVTNPTAPRAYSSGERKFTGQDWVGGAGLAEFGSAAMRLNTWTGDLTARKSWFFFDNEVVCLGADITGGATSPVHTTVENRRLSEAGDEALVIDGQPAPATPGWQDVIDNPSWLTLDGTGGVWFPAPVTLRLKREARSGSWYDINRGYPATPVTRNYLTAWIDHGAQPSGAEYAYVLLPDADAAATAAYAAAPDVEIVANNSAAQAVRDRSTGVTAAHFWAAGGGSAGGVTSDGPAAVIVRRAGGSAEVAVSDPTWKRTAPLVVTVEDFRMSPVALDPAITVLETEPDLRLSVAVTGARGRSITANFSGLVPRDDFASIAPGETLLLDALANDVLHAEGLIRLHSIGAAAHGRTSLRGGALCYDPDPGFAGMDSFSYQVEAGGTTAAATVIVEVADTPTAPVPSAVTASTDDGNVPANTLDGNLATRWSALGNGQWISYDFGAPRLIAGLSLAFYQGNARTATFEVVASSDGATWQPVLGPTASSGATLTLERFDFPAPVFVRHLRVIGRGNSQSLWNSITEAAFHAHRNLPPVSPGVTLETPEGHPVAADLLAAASDPDALPFPLRLLHLSPPQYGTAVIDGTTAAITPDDGFVGEETLIYQLSDGHRVAEAPLSIRITRPTTLAGFLNRHFTPAEQTDPTIGDPAADPDGDHLPNLIEFALGSDPRESVVRPLLEVGKGTMSLTLTVDLLARDIELMPEWSADLQEWHGEGFVIEALGETNDLRTLRLTLPTGDRPRAFIRLRVRASP